MDSDPQIPREVTKPWGSEIWFALTPNYAGKLLRIDAGHSLSVQYHESKDETSYVLSGRVEVSQGRDAGSLEAREVGPGGTWRNEPGVVHSLASIEDAVVIEVSTPEVDDVIRLSDRYGRSDAPGT